MNIKITSTIIILFCFCNWQAISQDYSVAFETEICKCLSKNDQEANLGKTLNNRYQSCFKKSLVNYASFIDSETEGSYYQKLRQGDLKRVELFFEFKNRLIHSCDYYYNYIEKERESKYLLIKKNADSSKINRLTERIAIRPDYYGYLERAKLYFALGDFEKAITDLLKAKEPLTIAGEVNIWLGWSYEMLGHYESALKIYEENKKLVRLSDIPIKREIVRRKLGLGVSNPESTKNKEQKPKTNATDDLLKLIKKKG